MEMKAITENYWTQTAVTRTVAQTVKNYMVLSAILRPIIKIGGDKVDKIILKVSQFFAAVDVGRFVVNGKRYRLKSSGRGFRIVAV